MTATPTAQPIETGAVVAARPWVGGTECAQQRALIMRPTWWDDAEYALVWFPGLGDPAVGRTVMPIMTAKITDVRTLDDVPRSWVRNCYAACKRVNVAHAWRDEWRPFGFVLEAAARRL
jgi:hypothetical protein